jgi:hypothetical protein
MNTETLKVIAKRYMGTARSDDYVAWAIACLETNVDSKNIRILSSMQKPLYSSEVDEYFERSLAELGWTLPERRECLLEYSQRIAQQIVSRDILPLEGCEQIYRIAVALEYPEELSPWPYLDEGWLPTGFKETPDAEWDAAIISEAERLLQSYPTVRET